MKPLADLTGQKFNRLRILRTMGFNGKHHSMCLCRCDCGSETIEKTAEVQSGHVQSCGCLTKNRKPDLTGQKFGRLLVVKLHGKDKRNNRVFECLCDCGNTKPIAAASLVAGLIQSCGCLYKESVKNNLHQAHVKQVKHGLSGTGVHNSWNSMMQRCFNYKCQAFSEYGAVGITVCSFLRQSPTNLLSLLGHRPEGESLDRIVNSGSYTCGKCPECKEQNWPLNVRWATKGKQSENRHNAVMVNLDGVLKTRVQAAKDLGITLGQAIYKLKDNEVKTPQRVEFTPPAGVVPEGTKAGEEFDAVCTFRVKPDGDVCLVMLGDEKMPGYSERDKGKPSYKDEHDAMQEAAKQPMPGSGGGQVQTGYA